MASVLQRALSDLGSPESEPSGELFFLRPHVVEEIAHISDQELPRYLYHRYRYDAFPKTHEVDDYPPCVQIEPTSICNFRCVFCFQTDPLLTQRKEGHMGQMPVERFREIIDQIEGHVEFVTLFAVPKGGVSFFLSLISFNFLSKAFLK